MLWLLVRDGQPQSTRAWALAFAIMLPLTLWLHYFLEPGQLLARN